MRIRDRTPWSLARYLARSAPPAALSSLARGRLRPSAGQENDQCLTLACCCGSRSPRSCISTTKRGCTTIRRRARAAPPRHRPPAPRRRQYSRRFGAAGREQRAACRRRLRRQLATAAPRRREHAFAAPPARCRERTPAASSAAAARHAPTCSTSCINLKGGELDQADLLQYPLRKDTPNIPVRLLSRDPPDSLYLLQTGLVGGAGRSRAHASGDLELRRKILRARPRAPRNCACR